MTKVNKLKFRKLIISILNKYGAKLTEGEYHQYSLETPLGRLSLTVYDGAEHRSFDPWVASRFDDPERAARRLGREMNGYSGKWNHHFGNGTGNIDPEECAASFERDLQRIGLTPIE